MSALLALLKAHKEKVGLLAAALVVLVAFHGVFGPGLLGTAAKMLGAGAIGYNLKSLKDKVLGLVAKVA